MSQNIECYYCSQNFDKNQVKHITVGFLDNKDAYCCIKCYESIHDSNESSSKFSTHNY